MRPYYEKDAISIFLGDAREVLDDIGPVDLVITDPPYAVGAGNGEWAATAAVAIALHQAARLVRKGGALLAFSTTSGRGMEFTRGAVGKALPFNRVLIWHKTDSHSRVAGPWQWDAVAIMAFGRASFGDADASSVFSSAARFQHVTNHRAELPEAIADWLYRPFVATAPLLLDPFMGSGTLLLPAVRRGLPVIGIEIDEAHCEAAARRLEAATLEDAA